MNEIPDHELFQLLLSQNDAAWRHIWEQVVLAECAVYRNAELVRKWGCSRMSSCPSFMRK